MINLWMEVKLFPLQVVDEGILFVDELVQSLNLLGQHDDFVLKVLHLHFNVLVLCECLLYINNLCLVWLNLVITISQQVVQSLDLLVQRLILSLDIPIPPLLLSQVSTLLFKLRNHELEFLVVLYLRIELILQSFLVLLHKAELFHLCLELSVAVFPFLNLTKSALQDTVDPVVLDLWVAHLCLIALDLIL